MEGERNACLLPTLIEKLRWFQERPQPPDELDREIRRMFTVVDRECGPVVLGLAIKYYVPGMELSEVFAPGVRPKLETPKPEKPKRQHRHAFISTGAV